MDEIKLRVLLRRTLYLLDFERGNAYISANFIIEQDDIRKQISDELNKKLGSYITLERVENV